MKAITIILCAIATLTACSGEQDTTTVGTRCDPDEPCGEAAGVPFASESRGFADGLVEPDSAEDAVASRGPSVAAWLAQRRWGLDGWRTARDVSTPNSSPSPASSP
jgi:hypothetical protein